MTIAELQILLDLNCGNEVDVLDEHSYWTRHGCYLFVDSEDGHCYLFNENGKIDDIKKMKKFYGYFKVDTKKIVIPDSIENIGIRAFFYYTSLENIEIPKSVKSIGNGAFYNCISLKEVIFKGKTMDQVKAMDEYPWGIENESIIKCC